MTLVTLQLRNIRAGGSPKKRIFRLLSVSHIYYVTKFGRYVIFGSRILKITMKACSVNKCFMSYPLVAAVINQYISPAIFHKNKGNVKGFLRYDFYHIH